MIILNEKYCTGCSLCINSCPFGALIMKDGVATVNDKCTDCNACVDSCNFGAIKAAESGPVLDTDISKYKGVWVFAEQRDGVLMPAVFELLCEGKKLANELDTELIALLLCEEAEDMPAKLACYGADRVVLAEHPLLKDYTTDAYNICITQILEQKMPDIFLLAATYIGRDLAPRLAGSLHTGLTADCTALEIDPETKLLMQTRPAFGGNLMATIVTPRHRPQMATVRPGVMKKCEPKPIDVVRRELRLEEAVFQLNEIDVRSKVLEAVKAARQSVNLADAEIIVAGGRGVGGPEGFKLVRELADVLGGEVGASRAAVDQGWLCQSNQIGQTGKTVRPKLYFACGISGAIQHIAGMQDSGFIVAINKDPESNILKIADLGIVGDVNEVLPVLIQEIRSMS